MDTPPCSICSLRDVPPQLIEPNLEASKVQFGDTKHESTGSAIGSATLGNISATGSGQVNLKIENNNYRKQKDASRSLQEKTILRFSPKKLPHFVGRQLELDLMRIKLESPSSNSDNSPLRFVVWGMAGVGKTQLVHKYLGEVVEQKYKEKTGEKSETKLEKEALSFNTIWLKASTLTDLDNAITRTVHEIRVHSKKSRTLHALDHRSKLKYWLEFDCLQYYSNYILVLDDVREQTFSEARSLIPMRGAACRVIITTRSRIIAEDFMLDNDKERCCEIKVFNVKTAEDMFYAVSKVTAGLEKEKVADVVKAIGCLPLAIETAANRAKLYGLDDVWRERKAALDWEDMVSYYDDHQHYRNKRLLKNAFDHFWDLIARPETPEANLFGDLSFFDSNSISVSLLKRRNDQSQGFSFVKLFVNENEKWTSNSWMDPIIRLERTSLITQRSDGKSQVLWIHKLVQALSRDQLINEGNLDKHIQGGADRLQQAVLAAHKHHGVNKNSTPCEEILRHIQSILAFMKEVEKSPNGFEILKANLLNIRESVIELLWKGGWYRDALDTARETFHARKDILGSQHPDNMKSLNIYIKALLNQGCYREAEPLIEQSFQKINAFRGWYQSSAYTMEYLTCLDNCAVMLRYKGEFEQAVDKSDQAWREGKKKLGAKDRHSLRSLATLALAYQSCGYYTKALRHSRQALEALELQQNILKDDDLDTLASRNCYASALYHQGLYVDAEREIERALYGISSALGDKHPDTLSSLQNYAAIHRAQGNYQSALEITQKVCQGRQEMLGKDHPDTLASLDHLASIYLCQGKYELAGKEAQISFVRGLEVFPAEHPALLTSLRNFATARRLQGYFQDAKAFYEDVLVGRQKKLRPGHPDTLISLSDTAWGLSTQGNYGAAEGIYQVVYRRQCEELGKEHPHTLVTLSSLALILNKLGRYEEAKDAAESAWTLQEETLGVKHPDTLTSMHNYAVILRHQRLDEDAASLAQQVLRERKRALGEQHPDTLASHDSYASALRCLGQYEEAERLCKQGLLWRRKVFADGHPDILSSLDTYSLVLRSQNKDARSQTQLALEGRQNLEDDNPEKLICRYNYGLVLHIEGQLTKAYKEIEEVLNIQQKILKNDHPDTLSSSHQLGVINLETQNYEKAEKELEKAFEGRKDVLGIKHPDTLATLSYYCLTIAQQGELQRAQNFLSSQLGIQEVALGLRQINSFKDLPNSRGVSHHVKVKAIEKLTKIRIALGEDALNQQSNHLKINLAMTLLEQEKGEEAEQTLRCIKAHPDISTLLRLSFLQQGKVYEAQGTFGSQKGSREDLENENVVQDVGY